jgi:predicted TIM-barrel fold metal-dependent hydrolase
MAKRKIIDAHHHLWDLDHGRRYAWLQDLPRGVGAPGDVGPIARSYLVADLKADGADYDLVKSVHVEALPIDPVAEARWVQGIADTAELCQAIVARAELHLPDVEKTIAAQKHCRNLRGVRHVVNWHRDPRLTFVDRNDLLTDGAWNAGFKLLKKYDLSFDLQLYPSQMGDAAALAKNHPDTLIVLNHTGMPNDKDEAGLRSWRQGMRALAANANVVAKISGLGMLDWEWTVGSIRPFVLETIDIFGVDRSMFASNFPVDRLYSSFGTLYGAFETIVAAFSVEEQAALFHDNAARIYRL